MIARMTLEEKVGQVVQPDIASITPEEYRRYSFGSVLTGGNSAPGGHENAPAPQWLALADAYWDASMSGPDGGLAIPVIWGIDAVHGHTNIVGATLFPHNIGLGAMRDPDLIHRIGEVTAIEMSVTGIDWTSRRPSPSSATTAGAAPMKASPRIPRSSALMPAR